MTLQDALTQARETGQWLRPYSWRGSGTAISIIGDELYCVPASGETLPRWIAIASLILGEWDVVSPEQVAGERK